MATKLTVLLLAAAVNINSLANSSNTYNVNEGKWLSITEGFDFNLRGSNERIYKKKESFLIECKKSAEFNFTIFPKLDLYEVRDVHLANFLVKGNINFGSILDHFGINNTKKISVYKMKGALQPLAFSNGFERLENLTFQYSVITNLDENAFQALKEITELIMFGNKITDLPRNLFTNLTNLEMLVLSNNTIKVLDDGLFTHQEKMKRLELNDNEMSDLPRNIFANLTNLEVLTLSKNKIEFLDEGLFTHQKKLKELTLNGNKISDLPRNIFANLRNLDMLVLSTNTIKVLEEGLFSHQRKLSLLDLENNEISDLHRNIFANLTIERLLLSQNKIKFLHEGLFSHQNKLMFLTLYHNQISDLPENIFANLTSLETLHITQNGVHFPFTGLLKVNIIELFGIHKVLPPELPIKYDITSVLLHRLKISKEFSLPSNFELIKIKECEFEFAKNVTNNTALLHTGKRVNSPHANIIANQKKLKYLSLEMNQLTILSDELFNGLNKLEHLDLSYNKLTSISRLIFRELHNLNTILLGHNHIESIDSNAFVNTTKLMRLDLSYNRLQYFDAKNSPFMYLEKLLFLHLSHNKLTTLPSGWKDIKTLRFLDLGFNNISSYKYGDIHNSKNKIYYKEHHHSEDEWKDIRHDKYLTIFLNNISLKCDCSMLRFLFVQKDRLINEFVKYLSESKEKGQRCKDTITSNTYNCPITQFITCKCTTNFENIIEMRCVPPTMFNSSMSYLPINPNKSLELYIDNNIFTELPNLQNNEHVKIIQASYNKISDIKLENVPPNLRFLDVSHNKITTISADVIAYLHNRKKLESFLIGNNPWQCDCSINTKTFVEFFKKNISMTDFQETEGRLPSNIDIKLSSELLEDYCEREAEKTFYTKVAVFSAIIGILGILIVILLYKYKKAIKIWLYGHNICLCCIGEDEFDKDKKFDAFISYSYHDEDLAVSILNELETGNPKYKICIHERDFVPGRLIQHSIAESMDNSCRTIIILSKNFLRSFWGQREFRRAYETGLVERRMRLIIVINGDIGETEQLEPTIRSYLKAHTYIKWGDPWFWQKMRYALPHQKRNDGGNLITNNIEMRQMN